MRTVSLFREQLIPAWAGKTTLRVGQQDRPTAHPRMGGENANVRAEAARAGGSSPRGRGKRRMVLTTGWPVRLIPARAGKTPVRYRRPDRRRAHPRAGGENWMPLQTLETICGSSPRGRGKRRMVLTTGWPVRLIPARAGKTPVRYRRPDRRRAHPRAGGENWMPLQTLETICGSSPRGRGKRAGPLLAGHAVRLIPAWAGKTLFLRAYA